MSLTDSFLWGMGFGIGADAAKIALTKGEEVYRKKFFDAVVLQDLNSIREQGNLLEREYPFPDNVKMKKPPFFVRHRVFTGGCLAILIYEVVVLMLILKLNQELAVGMCIVGIVVFQVFCFFSIVGILVKKLLRGGKKAADISFQWKYINAGKDYWSIREQVRVALENGTIDVQMAEYHLRNTELGRIAS